jgi:hypothetical protein
MYCLRTFLPLLLLPLPLSLSPIHLTILLVLTWVLNKPCAYCSLLLVILFASSCHWSGRCFWSTPTFGILDSSAGNTTAATGSDTSWLPYFLPRLYTTPSSTAATNTTLSFADDLAAFLLDVVNSTVSTLAGSAASSVVTQPQPSWRRQC